MQSWELSPLLPVPSVQLFSASHNAFQMDHFPKCIKLLKIQYGCCIAFQLVLFLTTFLELLSEAKLMVGSIISHLYFFRQYVIKTGYIQAPKMNQTLWRVKLCLALLAGGGGSYSERKKKKKLQLKVRRNWKWSGKTRPQQPSERLKNKQTNKHKLQQCDVHGGTIKEEN